MRSLEDIFRHSAGDPDDFKTTAKTGVGAVNELFDEIELINETIAESLMPLVPAEGTGLQLSLLLTRTIYVDAALGNDSNDGLTSGSGAFKTIQAAVNSILKRIDAPVTISVADGTYPEDVQIFGFVGSAFIYLIGNTTTPTNCIVNSVTVAYCSAPIEIKGFDAIVANNYGFSAYASTHVSIGNCRSVTVKAYGGAVFSSTKGYIFDCVFSNGHYGVASIVGAAIYIRGISGTGNTHVLYASTGGIIGIKDNVTISGTNAKVTEGGLIVPFELGSGVIQTPSGTSLPATTGTVAVTMDSKTKALTPTGNCTFNADTSGTTGDECTFFITTSGTTSYTMTFGTNFKSVGTLATGTVTAKVFTITFKKLGSVWYETSRTAAMT